MIPDSTVWKTLTSYTQDSSPILHTLALPPTQTLSSYEAHTEHVFIHVLST